MKVFIEAESQEEFDAKRPELIKALAGKKLSISIQDGTSTAGEPRKPRYRAQAQMLEYWDGEFKKMLGEIKQEIEEALT